MTATIRDVARRAGVSIATVSRAMRDPSIVSAQTLHRVQEAASDLDYTPSQLGRQLAERRHAANGIVFPDLSGPYYAEVVLGYEAVASELGRAVLILATHGRPAAAEMVTRLAGRCDGLVVLGPTVSDTVLLGLAARGVPLVTAARPPVAGVDSVSAENAGTARALATHLADQGARTVLFLGDPALSSDVQERLAGLEAGADAAGIGVRVLPVSSMDEEGGARAAEGLASGDLPDAIACANDELALGLMTALRTRGVVVPRDLLVTGWDDIMAARYAELTTVRQPLHDLGATAARFLDDFIAGRRSEPRHEVLPTELIVRSSSSPAKGDNQ
ncbi:LacI family DNA-binding transcriptional regulator [Nocardioides zhouii]|uniref:LacI family transcriptional regulator n=1 Tax=Nocardioides zhouii TaxID=1168729 RepID=A0A4Q2T927_9ACTN|nr:LacI family DNA-binding transcriptional regulator [Nocardioides zhouii]RYC13339.1 LacI family transcriptional regulator [Nocardioides zhouii]